MVVSPAPVYAGGVAVVQQSTNGMATASLVFGIISWILCPCLGRSTPKPIARVVAPVAFALLITAEIHERANC